MLTNNANVNVDTGGIFQVPSLIGVAWRTPLFHDGSAGSVGDVLGRAHGGAGLSAAQRSDLTSYVETF
jgi:hypothetical protein